MILLCLFSLNAVAQITPNGVFDNPIDRSGIVYSLTGIAVSDTIRDTGTIVPNIVVPHPSGYFQLYLEPGCGMDNSSDPTNVARLQVLDAVLTHISNFIHSPLTSTGETVNLWVRGTSALPGGHNVAYATSFYSVANGSGTTGIADNMAWITMHSGHDGWRGLGGTTSAPFLNSTSGTCFHGIIAFNSRINWHTDLTTPPYADEMDEYTVMLGEVLHALGLSSLIASDGTSILGPTTTYYSRYDMQLFTPSGLPLIVNTGYASPMNDYQFNPAVSASVLSPIPTACITDSTTCDSAIQYIGSVNLPVYTPNCYEQGFSLSCLEDQCYSSPTGPTGNNAYFVTSNVTNYGSMKRFLQPEERLVLTDIGFTTDTTYGDTSSLNYYSYGSTIGVGNIVGGMNDGLFGVDSTDTVRIAGFLSNDLNADAFEGFRVEVGTGTVNVQAGDAFTTVTYIPGPGDGAYNTLVASYIPVNLATGNRGARMALSMTSALILCQGATYTPSCSGTGYSWFLSSGTGIVTINSTTGQITASTTATGSFSYYYGGGGTVICSGSGTVVAAPQPITGPSTVCPGVYTYFSDPTAGGTWSSSASGVLGIVGSTAANPAPFYSYTAGTATITYNLNNNPDLSWGGCIATKTVTVVNVGVIHGPVVCAGANVTMTETVAGGAWSVTPSALASINPASGLLHGISAGVVTVSYGVTVGGVTCYATFVDTVLASAPATITGVSPICTGECYTFSASVAGGTWTSANTGIATAATSGPYTGTICGVGVGTTNISYTFHNICGTFTSVYSVTVIAGVGAVTITGCPSFLCGATAILHGVYHGAGSPSGGVWATSDPSVVTVSATGDITVLSTTGYGYVSYTKTSGSCSGSAVIPVYPTTATLTGPSTLCQGSTITLTGTGDGNGNGALIGSSTSWTPATLSNGYLWNFLHVPSGAPTAMTAYFTGTSGGTQIITYSFTDACGTFSATHAVTVTANTDVISGSATICACAGNTFTYTSTVSGGTWYCSDPGTASINPTTGVLTPTGANTAPVSIYLYHVTTVSGCTFYTYFWITVNPCPNTAIVGLTEICNGINTSYTNATAGGTWSTSGTDYSITGTWTSTAPARATIHAANVGTQILTYTVTNSYGCTMVATLSIKVDPVTAGTITVPTPLCVGTTGTCTSTSPGGIWSSANSGIATVNPATGVVYGVTAGTTTISYYITNICGNFLATKPITVLANPVLGGPHAVCSGSSISLTPATTTWTYISGPLSSVTPTGVVTGGSVTVPTPAYVKYTASTGCFSMDTITVNPTPTITGPATLCMPTTGTYTQSTGMAGIWTSSVPTVATINPTTGVLYPLSLGTTIVKYVVTSTGCFSTKVVTVCATPAPTIGLNPSPTTSLCVGQCTNIYATLGAGSSGGPYTVGWTSSNPGIATVNMTSPGGTTSTAVICAVSAGTAYITYSATNSCGCTGTVITTITVHPLPHITGPSILCMGTSGTFTETTGSTGVWSSSVPTVASINPATGVVTTVSPGTTVITFTTSFGCTSSVTLTVCAVPAPNIGRNPSPTTTLCVGQCTNIYADMGAGSPGGPYTVGWTSSNPGIATVNMTSAGGTTSTAVICAISAGTAYITYSVTNSCGCTGTVITTITVNPTPHITGPSILCMGTSGTFTETTGLTGVWSSSVPTVASINPATGVVTTVSPGTTVITFTSSLGCTASLTLTVCAVPAPTIGMNPSPTTTLCVGQCTNIYATLGAGSPGGPYTVSWTSSNPGIATVNMTSAGGTTSTAVICAVSAGTAYITYSATNSCGCTGTVITTITVNPTPHITGPSILCMGTTGTFTQTTGLTGTWSSSLPTVASINPATGVVTPVSPGTTVITFTTSLGCTASITLTVCATPAPTIGMNPSPTTTLCVGQCTNIYATLGISSPGGPYTVSWTSSNPAIATVNMTSGGGTTSTAVICAVSAGTAYITYSATNSCGCTGTVITTITVNANPHITGPSILCQGTTGTFTETTGAIGVWSSSNPAVASINPGTGVVYALTPGTTVITFTTRYGCTASLTLTVCATPVPVIGMNPSPTTNLCTGQTTNIYASPGATGGTYTVSWTSSNPGIASVNMTSAGGANSTAIIYAVSAGTAYITYSVTNSCGCTGTVITTINVGTTPVISGPSVLCVGTGGTYTESTGVGGVWSSSNPAVATIDPTTGVVTTLSPGTTVITFTTGFKCTASIVLTVCDQPNPVIGVNPSPTTTLCTGDLTYITATPGIAGTGGPYTVSWTTSDPTVASVDMTSGGGAISTATIYAVGVGTADITYTVTNSCGCTGYVVTTITVNQTPSISGPSVLCMGSTATFTESTGVVGSWTTSDATIASIDPATGDVYTVSPGTVVISYITKDGCSARLTLTICDQPNPKIVVNPSPTTSLCIGSTTYISATPAAGAGYTVSWTSSNPSVASVSMITPGGSVSTAIVYAVGVGTANITYTITNSCGCTGYVITKFTVYPVPGAISGPSTVCQGSVITLTDPSTGGIWTSSDNTIASVDAAGNVTGVSGGTVTISYAYPVSAGGCAATYTVTVIGRAVVCVNFGSSSACGGCWAAIFAGTAGATVIYHVENCAHAILAGGFSTGANSVIPLTSLPAGTCYLCIDKVIYSGCTWNGCGCPTGSCCANVQGKRDANPDDNNVTTNNATNDDLSNVSVIPNPNKGTFTITGTIEDVSSTASIQLEIVDMLGKVLYRDVVKADNGIVKATISLDDNIANGIYLLRLKNAESMKVMRFTLDR